MMPPSEWGNLDRGRARLLVKTLWRYVAGSWPQAPGPGTLSTFYQMAAYLPVATGHTGLLRFRAILRRLWCRARLAVAGTCRSKSALTYWFNAYQEALIHERRLNQILRLPPDQVKRPSPKSIDFTQPDSAGAITGFYPVETFAGTDFRWSEPAAIAEIKVPAGRLRLRLHCLKVPHRSRATLLLFFNDRLVPQRKMVVRKDEIELSVKSSESGVSRLLWTCEPFVERGSKRRLGLPVISLSVEQRGSQR
jgi:hypothetical protein